MVSAIVSDMIWILLVYTMGFFVAQQALENSFEYMDDPWAAMLWPLVLLALVIQWLETR